VSNFLSDPVKNKFLSIYYAYYQVMFLVSCA